jgi:3-dehydroquinate synthase
MASPESHPLASTKTRTVRVELAPRPDGAERAYDVVIGHRLLREMEILFSKRHIFSPDFVVKDQNLPDNLINHFGNCHFSHFSAGESSKSISHVAALLSELARFKIPRTGTVIAFGGGVIGDLVGFVAASYLRGINFVQIPTTLLAMVDSSVGGKTGVNLPEGKNLVGAFHQPRLVVADLDTLATLPAREFAAGMAEVIKYGAIRDRALFDRVSKTVTSQDDDLAEIVEKCVTIKARIVERDEFETKGERALLNFGHTIGHAIEKATGYTRYLHGEAISIGMRAAAWLSVWHPETNLPEADARRIEAALAANHLPTQLDPAVDRAAILAALGNDKKVAADGGNRWVLLKKLGEAQSGLTVTPADVERALSLVYTKS